MHRNEYTDPRSSQQIRQSIKSTNSLSSSSNASPTYNNNYLNSNMVKSPTHQQKFEQPMQNFNALRPTQQLSQSYSQNSNQNQSQKLPIKIRFRKWRGAAKAVAFIINTKKWVKSKQHRYNILKEWQTTQKTYNLDLTIAINQIRRPMEQFKIITSEQSFLMFPAFQSMINLSNLMLQTITKALQIKNANQIVIGKQLNGISAGYKIYGDYFKSHSKSSKLLAELTQKNQNAMKSIQTGMQAQLARNNSKKQKMTIKDCMEQPLYRLFKYVLLLKEYIKKLPSNHKDFKAVTACHEAFHIINTHNNEEMKKLEDEQKKVKLDKYFGQYLRENRILLSEMKASTIQFDVKLYIFQDIIIITRIHTILGSQRQQKLTNFILNQFGYVTNQQQLKYFKNILMLIGTQQCIHLLFPDEGSRAQLFKCLQKIFKQLRIRQFERRKLIDPNKSLKSKKLTFTLQEDKKGNNLLLQPQFRVQVLGIQVRPLSALSNDTAYVTRFMIPYYYEDQVNFLQSEGIPQRQSKKDALSSARISNQPRYHSLPFGAFDQVVGIEEKNLIQNTYKCINQRVEVHFSMLQQIYNAMKNICSDKLPDIDPITKDVNLYSKGKGKTRFYELRKFFFQEFFNFVFRHPVIMSNPIWFISKLRINEDLWNYSTQRNARIKQNITQKDKQKKYSYDHCNICKRGKINSMQQFEHYRAYFNSNSDHRCNKQLEKYCFNFFSLIRMRMLSFNFACFNTVERILVFYHYLQGRLDYPFLIHRCNDKFLKIIKIYIPSVEQNFVSVMIDIKSTVGQVLDELGNAFKMKNSFDFDLVGSYNGKRRVLDRDQYLLDVVKCLNIQYEETTADKKELNKITENKGGFFDSIKKWGKQMFNNERQQKNKIYILKTTYLNKQLQFKSLSLYPQKKQLQIQQIFWSIKKSLIKLTDQQFIQVAALFYCLKQLDNIQYFTYLKMSNKPIQKIIPDEHSHIFQYQQEYRRKIGLTIQNIKNILIKNNKNTQFIHDRILQIIITKEDYITYYIEVEPKEMPSQFNDSKVNFIYCLIGINYKNLIITRSEHNTTPLIKLPIKDLQWYVSVFSIFIRNQKYNFRFDGKMLFHFGELLRKYQTISKKFPQYLT